MANIYDIQFYRGDDFPFTAQYECGSVPVNIAGAEILMTYKANFEDADSAAIFQIGTGTGEIVITSAVNGQFKVTIPSAKTLGLVAPNLQGVYDLVIYLPGPPASRTTLLSGTLTLNLNVTDKSMP